MLAPKSDFIGLENITHLTSGGEPPLLKAHREAFEAYARDKALGQPGYWAHWNVGDEVRSSLAEMTGMATGDVALTGSASEGIARVISSIAWREGDNVVTSAPEYASGRFAFARLQKLGVECRIVEMDEDIVDCARLVEACDQRTRLVYASQVSYLTGQLLDMPTLSAGLAHKGVPLLLDVSHALGVVPVSGRQADFMVSCCYKWLLGTQTGILFWNRERQPDFEPLAIGWNSATGGATVDEYTLLSDARRAEVGNRNHLDVYLLRQSLEYLQQFGIDAIASHARALGDEILEKLRALGLDVTTPDDPSARAGNICFRHANPEGLMRRAAVEGIYIWGDNGRVRISTHLFNDNDDLQALFDRLPIYLREEGC